MSQIKKVTRVKLEKVGFEPAWSDQYVGQEFEVVSNRDRNHFNVVENGEITNRLLSRKCVKILK